MLFVPVVYTPVLEEDNVKVPTALTALLIVITTVWELPLLISPQAPDIWSGPVVGLDMLYCTPCVVIPKALIEKETMGAGGEDGAGVGFFLHDSITNVKTVITVKNGMLLILICIIKQ